MFVVFLQQPLHNDASTMANDNGINREQVGPPRMILENLNRQQDGVLSNGDSFPSKLHSMLDDVDQHGLSNIVSWQPHGRWSVLYPTSMSMA